MTRLLWFFAVLGVMETFIIAAAVFQNWLERKAHATSVDERLGRLGETTNKASGGAGRVLHFRSAGRGRVEGTRTEIGRG